MGGGGGGGQTGWARLNRLKVEETVDVGANEIATEREVQREISLENNLSQSWEDLSLTETKDTRGRAKKQERAYIIFFFFHLCMRLKTFFLT